MVNRPKMQGTALETAAVKAAEAYGMAARRIAEGGSKDLGDVFVSGGYGQETPHVAVIWKRLVKGDGARRKPDGEPIVAVLSFPDYLELLRLAETSAIWECKATQTLNVTRTLSKAKAKAQR